MGLLLAAAKLLSVINAPLLMLGRWLGAGLMGLMVVVILIQVVFRYGLNNALPWTEELSRFMMLWMVGVMAPTAFRHGGFISINTLRSLLPVKPAAIVNMLLLVVSVIVLWWAMQIGWAEVTGIGGKFALPALKVPTSVDFSTWVRVPRAAMMASLAIGVTLMFMVNCELLLRVFIELIGGGARLEPLNAVRELETE